MNESTKGVKNNWLKWLVGLLIAAIVIAVVFVIIKQFDTKLSFNPESNKEENQEGDKDQDDLATIDQETFDVFPVRFDEFVVPAKMYGLWPYGLKGKDKNDHNEGHPGWDFELKKGSKVYAIGDMSIAQIHDGDGGSDAEQVKVIEAYSKLKSGKYHIVYHSVINLEPNVVEGATIKAGEPLAEAGRSLSADSVMIHFGIFQPRDSVGSCPTPYFSSSAQAVLNQILAISLDTSTNKPFTSACVGKINKALYEANYPERIKDFGGAEQFE